MRANVCLLVVAGLASGGCATPFVQQGTNEFQSNTYVAYLPPSSPTAGAFFGERQSPLLARTLDGALEGDKQYELEDGQCFAVDFAGGFLHDAFASGYEKALATLQRTPVRAEVSTVIAVSSRNLSLSQASTPATGTLVFNNRGQIKMRPLSGKTYDRILGPLKYEGGDLLLTVAVTEQDSEEYRKMLDDTLAMTAGVQDKMADSASGKTSVERALDAWAERWSKNPSATLSIGPYSYIAVGTEAVKASARILYSLHGQDDAVIRETVLLQPPSTIGLGAPRLRYGTYIFTRASVMMGDIKRPPCLAFSPTEKQLFANFSDPVSCRLPDDFRSSKDWISTTWIAVNVRDLKANACQSAPATAPS